MSDRATRASELWVDLIDRDLEILIGGGEPFNDDLAPLESFVEALSVFGDVEPSEEFIGTQASRSAAASIIVRETPKPTPPPLRRGSRVMIGVRRRVTALATSVLMIAGMTGMAWAADSAVPGDWNYGIDRALEAIGIGAGGAEERLLELQALKAGETGDEAEVTSGPVAGTIESDKVTGLEKAYAAVIEANTGNERSAEVHAGVAILLDYLANTEKVDGLAVSELAKLFAKHHAEFTGRPEHAGKPDHAGGPEDPGKPEDPGRPDHAGTPDHAIQP